MRASKGIALYLALSLCLPAARILGQETTDTTSVRITGTIFDGSTRRPLEDVDVRIRELDLLVQTDGSGQFVFPAIPLGTYELELRHEGYETTSGPLEVVREGSFTVALDPLDAENPRATARLEGRVRNGETGEAIENVGVSITGTDMSRLTDSRGRFEISGVPPGSHTLVFRRMGWAPRTENLTVEPMQVVDLEVDLSVEPIPLDPIGVEVERRSHALEMAGFYTRRLYSPGYYITQEEIEERMPYKMTDLFLTLPGVRVIPIGADQIVELTGSRSMTLTQPAASLGCYPNVWIDGQIVHTGTPSARGVSFPAYLNRLVSPSQVAGMEVYHRASRIPVQYNISAVCGVIVIWTR